MEFLRKYLGLDEIQARRKQQLQLQATQDAILNTKTFFCPHVLNMYLLQDREDNRLMVQEYDLYPLASYVTVVKRQLDLIDARQNLLNQVLVSENVCQNLSTMLMTQNAETYYHHHLKIPIDPRASPNPTSCRT